MKWILDAYDGFIVRSDAGNYAYASATSIWSTMGKAMPEQTARDMARAADSFAHLPGVADYNEKMSQLMLAAEARIHQEGSSQ